MFVAHLLCCESIGKPHSTKIWEVFIDSQLYRKCTCNNSISKFHYQCVIESSRAHSLTHSLLHTRHTYTLEHFWSQQIYSIQMRLTWSWINGGYLDINKAAFISNAWNRMLATVTEHEKKRRYCSYNIGDINVNIGCRMVTKIEMFTLYTQNPHLHLFTFLLSFFMFSSHAQISNENQITNSLIIHSCDVLQVSCHLNNHSTWTLCVSLCCLLVHLNCCSIFIII